MTQTQNDYTAAELFADEETGMVWQPVESSQIAEIGYDASTATLGIRFKPGKKSPASEYHYANVPVGTHHALITAESVGTYFGQNIKSRPDLYPFVKVEAENPPQPPSSPNGGGATSSESQNSTPIGTIDVPSTALTVIDTMADDLLFTPNAVTDAQLAAGRDWYLTEAKKYDISTEKARTELKRFARPLQKLRTGIEARAKELTGATKRKIAAIDAEKRRLIQIVGGIEDEVLAPLTSWEAEEEARKIRLASIVNELSAKGQRVYMDMAEIQSAIAELEAFDLSTMQEYKIGAESAIAASLKVLNPELERRKEMEAQAAELATLRAEAAERAEKDRMEVLAKVAQQQAEQATAARVAAIAAAVETEKREALAREEAADRRLREMEAERIEAAAQAERDREAAVEAERKRVADAAKREQEAAEARAADKKHRDSIHEEIIAAMVLVSPDCAPAEIVSAIAKGLIPNVTIQY